MIKLKYHYGLNRYVNATEMIKNGPHFFLFLAKRICDATVNGRKHNFNHEKIVGQAKLK